MKILILLCFIFSLSLSSQTRQLIDTSDYATRNQVIKNLESRYSSLNSKIRDSYKGKMKREMEAIYEASQNHFLESIKHKKFIFNSEFNTYLDSLGLQIQTKYPTLKNSNLIFFLSKDPIPNAFCLGDHTFVVNLGLFTIFDNEHEFLSVLTHEVAHQLLEHGKKSIENKAVTNINYLDRKSSTVRSLSKEQYNRGLKSFSILKSLLYEQGEVKRKHETEADSLGYLIYKSLDSHKMDYIHSLDKLVLMDSVPSIEVSKSIYKTVFDLPSLPFDEAWFKSESFDNYNYDFYTEKITKDSISSHPETVDRIQHLKSIFPELNEDSEAETASSTFLNLQKLAIQSKVENLFYLNEYGLSVYLILYRLQHDIDVDYCKAWLGINFKALYEAKKNYQLNRYLDRVVPKEQSESYQQFLNFMWNLKLSELKEISEYYALD